MNVIINNIEFDFIRNQYGTHNWVAFDYSNVINEESVEHYLGNLEVLDFIHNLLDKTDSKQQSILYGLLKLVSDSYEESVGEQFAWYGVSYRDSLTFSIGKRVRKYQLDKVAESWD